MHCKSDGTAFRGSSPLPATSENAPSDLQFQVRRGVRPYVHSLASRPKRLALSEMSPFGLRGHERAQWGRSASRLCATARTVTARSWSLIVYSARYSPRRVVDVWWNGSVLSDRAGQVLVESSSGGKGQLGQPSASRRGEREGVGHSPASRRAARSAAMSSADKTRPSRASAKPSASCMRS